MKQVDKGKIKRLVRKHGLELLLVYGSVAKGQAKKNSDIDVAFRSVSKVNFLGLMADLVEILEFSKVDLVNLDTANPLLLSQIVSDYVVLYGKKRAVDNLEIRAFNRYVDFKPFFDMENDFVNRVYKGMRNVVRLVPLYLTAVLNSF